jgi:hypothetical protein
MSSSTIIPLLVDLKILVVSLEALEVSLALEVQSVLVADQEVS